MSTSSANFSTKTFLENEKRQERKKKSIRFSAQCKAQWKTRSVWRESKKSIILTWRNDWKRKISASVNINLSELKIESLFECHFFEHHGGLGIRFWRQSCKFYGENVQTIKQTIVETLFRNILKKGNFY